MKYFAYIFIFLISSYECFSQSAIGEFMKIPVEAAMAVGDPEDTNLYINATEYLMDSKPMEDPECDNQKERETEEEVDGNKVIFSIRYLPDAGSNKKRDDELISNAPVYEDLFNIIFQYDPIDLPGGGIKRIYKFEKQMNEILTKKTTQNFLSFDDYRKLSFDIISDKNFADVGINHYTPAQKQELANNMAYQFVSYDLLFTPQSALPAKIKTLQQQDREIIPKAFASLFQTINQRAKAITNKSNSKYIKDGKSHEMAGEIFPTAFISSADQLFKGITQQNSTNLLFQTLGNGQAQLAQVQNSPVNYILSHAKTILDEGGYDAYLILNGISQKNGNVLPDINLVSQDRESKEIYSFEAIANEKKNIPIASQYVYDLDGTSIANIPSSLSLYMDQMFKRRDSMKSLYTDIAQPVSDASISWQNFKSEKGRYLGIKTAIADFPDGSQSFIIAVNHQQYKRMLENSGSFMKGLSVALNTTVGGGASNFQGGNVEQFFVTIRHQNALILELIESKHVRFGGLVGTEFEASTNENLQDNTNESLHYKVEDKRDLDSSVKLNKGVYLDITPNSKNSFRFKGSIQHYVSPEIKPFIENADSGKLPKLDIDELIKIKNNGARIDVDYVRQITPKAIIQIFSDLNFTKGGDRYSAGIAVTNKIGKSSVLRNEVVQHRNTSKNSMSVMDLISPNEGIFINTDVQIRKLNVGTTIQLSREPFFGVRGSLNLSK